MKKNEKKLNSLFYAKISKENLLNILSFEVFKNKKEMKEYINKLSVVYDIDIIPTYREYEEEFLKNCKQLIPLYFEQTKKIIEFVRWVNEKSNEKIDGIEILNKLEELSLYAEGFNSSKIF